MTRGDRLCYPMPTMGLLDRLRPSPAPSDTAGRISITGESRDEPSIPNPLIEYDREAADDSFSLTSIQAEARGPFRGLSLNDEAKLIDARMFAAMVAAERLLERVGDLYDAIEAETQYYSEGIVITHPDKGAEKAYRDFAERTSLDFWLAASHGTAKIYGQSYPVFAGRGGDCMVYNLNPKRVAVGQQYYRGQRPTYYLGPNANALYNELALDTRQQDDNEWPEYIGGKRSADNSSGIRLDASRVYHRSVFKPPHERYAMPPIIRAWDQVTDRIILGEMIRTNAKDLKSQIRVWTIENGRPQDKTDLETDLTSMKDKRSYDVVTTIPVTVQHIVPQTVAELLADKTWMSMTDRCFRSMGLHMILGSGERMSGNAGMSNSDSNDVQLTVALNRLAAEMNTNLRIARWVFGMYATHGDTGLASLPPPSVSYRDTLVGAQQRIRAYVPLLQYGAISIRTFLEKIGVDYENEIAQLKAEMPLRDGENAVIKPYAAFAQTSTGNDGTSKTTESPASPGRPIRPDTSPENSATNQDNASGSE